MMFKRLYRANCPLMVLALAVIPLLLLSHGCGGEKSAKEEARETRLKRSDWSKDLEEFLPAIRACLAATPNPPGMITSARSEEGGMVYVRVLGGDRRHWECVASRKGDAVSRHDEIPVSELEADRGPIFTFLTQEPPRGECLVNEQAYGEDEELIGWLTYDVC